jgi:hypothetical protein
LPDVKLCAKMALKWLKTIFKIFYKIQVKNFAKISAELFAKNFFAESSTKFYTLDFIRVCDVSVLTTMLGS